MFSAPGGVHELLAAFQRFASEYAVMLTAPTPGKFRVPPPACSASPLPEAAAALSAMSEPKPRALPLRLVAAANTEFSVEVVRRWTAVVAVAAAMPPATST